MKTYLHKPSKVFLFLTCGKIQKYLNVCTTLLEVRKNIMRDSYYLQRAKWFPLAKQDWR